jgi:hypothetical protein
MKIVAVVLILSCAAFGQHIGASQADISNITSPGTSNLGIVNAVYYPHMCGTKSPPTWCTGSDMGAWVNSAAADCPNNGACRIHIAASPACHSFTTPIVFGLGKFVTLEGDPSQSSCMKYTPTTGTAITFDPGNPDRSPYGIRDLQLIGPGSGTSSTGVSLGPTNGGNAVNITGFRTGSNCCVNDGFGIGIAIANSFLVTIQTSSITGNGVGIATTTFLENLRLIGNSISHNTTNPLLLNTTGWTDVYSFGNSYDDNSGPISLPTTAGLGNHFNSSGDHFENFAVGAAAQPYITIANNSHATISGGVMLDDRTSGTNTGMINCSGASLVYIYGMVRATGGNTVNPFLNASGNCRGWLQFSQSTGTFGDFNNVAGGMFDSFFTFNTSPSFALLNGLQGASTQIPYGSNVTTGLTGNMSGTQLGGTTATAGMYLVCVAMFPTATGSATAIQATASGNANGTVFTANVGSVLSLAAAGNIGGGCLPIPMGTANISVATTGYSGSGTYTVRSEVNEIQ